MVYGDISSDLLVKIYREMGLPEPFVFPFYEDGVVAGLITGFIRIHSDGHKFLDVDHMIVRRGTRRKFHTMMAMSEAATKAAFDDGCAYILISILQKDSRRSGLRAWAERMDYRPFTVHDGAEWFVRHNERYVYDHGQGCEGSRSEAASGGSRSER